MISTSHASEGWSVGNKSQQDIMSDPNSGYYLRTALHFVDQILPLQKGNEIKLTDEQKHEAQTWELTEKEETRYLQLMQNRDGIYYKDKNMTPVEILGFNAQDDQERQHFAAIEAKQMIERASKELAFGAEVQKTMNVMHKASGYPTVRDYDYKKYSPHNKHALKLKSGDKLVFFTKTTESVKPITSQLIKAVTNTKNTQLDIFLVDDKVTAEKANKWAKSQSLPVKLVNSKVITLNLNKGQLSKVSKERQTPVLILIRDGVSESIAIGKF